MSNLEQQLADHAITREVSREFRQDAEESRRLEAENKRLRDALEAIAGYSNVDLSGEWPGPLRSVIRSMADCAKNALRETV